LMSSERKPYPALEVWRKLAEEKDRKTTDK
jgi:hypothetical protein